MEAAREAGVAVNTFDLRITLSVPETAPLTMQRILDFLEDLRAQGIAITVDGPSSDDLDRRLDALEAQIATIDMTDEARRELAEMVADQRGVNRVLRGIGR